MSLKPSHHRLWSSTDHRRQFIIPDEPQLPFGEFVIRTATGNERQVDEEALRPFEVTPEEAQAWAKAQLAGTLGELRGNALEFVHRLRARTDKLREDNRKTWEEGVAKAPPEVREAAEHVRSGLRRLGQALRRAARERGAGKPPPDAKPTPPEDGGQPGK